MQDRDAVVAGVCDHGVRQAIAVQIGDGDGHGRVPCGRRVWAGEGAGPGALQDRNGAAGLVGRDQVDLAIAVQVANGDCHRVSAGGVGLCVTEAAIAIADQHGNCIVVAVRDRDVRNAVPVEVGHDHAHGPEPTL